MIDLYKQAGLKVYLAGSDYNFRTATTSPQVVGQEMERALTNAGFDYQQVYSASQVHGKIVAYADGSQGADFALGRYFESTDGLTTDQAGLVLMIKFADCTPILFYDPVKQAIAMVHSGWRSTVQKISHVAIQEMQNRYQSRLEDLMVYVGPSIDQDNYEVGEEVYQAFAELGLTQSCLIKGQQAGKYHLSMVEANLALLERAGLSLNQIQVDDRSTYTDPDLHSARQEGSGYQLNALFVMID